jgi:hypothetical protein
MIGMVESLRGAFMLARFDKRGLGAFDGTVANARASFRVVWPLLGFYFVMSMLLFSLMTASGMETAATEPSQSRLDDNAALKIAALLGLGQVISWLGLIVIMEAILKRGALAHRFNTAVATYNWTLFWRKALEIVPILMVAAGLATSGAGLLQLMILGYSLAYLFFAMKTALDNQGFEASVIVFLEMTLALTVPLLIANADPETFQALMNSAQR